ncbi:hypothetical protein GWI33_016305 [Rhynchophorus ferrugineus]|uniref:Uncharacterized protein n=1 Tax=Rhynchophorus ferrugineus TaxID=354439 RepID=A0A834HXJ5_RHYFE|nr:hypothetical protein GWI33_016305 [Rhynchophorus ferrugineus]
MLNTIFSFSSRMEVKPQDLVWRCREKNNSRAPQALEGKYSSAKQWRRNGWKLYATKLDRVLSQEVAERVDVQLVAGGSGYIRHGNNTSAMKHVVLAKSNKRDISSFQGGSLVGGESLRRKSIIANNLARFIGRSVFSVKWFFGFG